ncbi:PEP-CTERM sorting domain-containing protein [Microcystis panniformis]|uniref:Alkaline phosphatase n=1 Tax=Microcystis panniformis FACHB-1757 TaxID=1638788 RepID=A0A0K1S5F3_9CHRO|nr:PEP-CTERM sorting domain-containing protein [Microcystis panniformis]AKV69211.1 Alkaline phosphatase [Microcystis panniformis FACHB-1757]
MQVVAVQSITTGALAIAGSVAAFGFANTAPVQAQVDCLPQSFNNFKTNPCRKGDKLFTHINSSGMGINDPNNFLTITETVLPLGDLHTFTFTPATPLLSSSGTYVIDYTIEIVDNPNTPDNELLTKMFEAFSAGYTTTGQTDSGVSLNKTVWSDAFGGSSLVGTSEARSLDIGGIGSPGLTVQIAPNIQKLYVRDTFSVSSINGSLNSITNDFRQKRIVKTPEPSAILGILAVAGVGAFARRKG